jgi:hypothetical protein
MNGEEVTDGRAMAHVATGASAGLSYQLPGLGRSASENALANPFQQDRTIVISNADESGAGNGKIYMYVGTKQSTGNAVEKAGLTNGNLYAVKVDGVTQENRTTGIGAATKFTLANLGSGNKYQTTGGVGGTNTAATAAGATSFLRPEDGAWNPKSPNKYYFVTTDQFDQVKDGLGSVVGRSRLWQLTFNDLSNPELGGNIQMLIDGTGPNQMFDNITVDADGVIILLEDVGNSPHNGKVWRFDPVTGKLTMVASHDTARFGNLTTAATSPFNQDEESSGVIDVTDLFTDVAGYDTTKFHYSLIDVQAHNLIAGELVEGGQLLLMAEPRVVPEPSTYPLLGVGLGLLGLVARRRRLR